MRLAGAAPRVPPWQGAYHYFRAMRHGGTWGRMYAELRDGVRLREGHEASPNAAIVDSQWARPPRKGACGYDGAKKVNGRERHLLVDSGGPVLEAKVHPTGLPDREGARLVLDERTMETFPRLRRLWADAGYRGKALREWIIERLGLSLEIVQRRSRWVWAPKDVEPELIPAGFEVIKRRWVAERTFAWITRNRRMSRDYEFLAETTGALIYICMIRLMLKRLVRGAA